MIRRLDHRWRHGRLGLVRRGQPGRPPGIRQEDEERKEDMPKAFSLTYGLDLDTEVASFWAWMHDVRDQLSGAGEAGGQVRELIESQRDEIDRFIAQDADPAAAKRTVTLALALVGFHYASHQKLLNGLRDYGLLESPLQPRPSIFDTITEPALESPEPPH
jgi:hypothetical protein